MAVSLSSTRLLTRSATRRTPERRAFPRWFEDRHGAIAAAIYLIVILAYDHYPLEHIQSTCACANTDPTQWMWSWKWLVYAIGHGQNPLLTDRIWTANRPFDLASVTLAPALAIPGVPLTALFGSITAYNLIVFAAPVLNGWAAYRLCRYVSGATWPSVLAGGTYAFSAYEVGHLLGHLNLVFVFTPPLLLLVALRYLNDDYSRRRTLLVALVLLLVQFGLSTELLLDMTAMAVVAWVLGFLFAAAYRRKLLELAVILTIVYLLVAAICSYYIYESLNGPAESDGEGAAIPADLLSYLFPTPIFKLGGGTFAGLSSGFITNNGYEQNNYLGLPLIGIVLAMSFSSWRERTTKIISLSMFVAFVLSLGTALTVDGHGFFKLPFNVLEKLPLFKLTIPSRLGLFVALGAALFAALWLSRARGRTNTLWRWLVGLAALACLIPNPSYAGRINAPYQPAFFTSNLYRKYVKANEIVWTIPFSSTGDEMLWQADTNMYFRLAGGYMGFPPYYDDPPLVFYQLFPGAPAPTVPGQATAEIPAFVRSEHIGVVLVEPDQAQDWPAAMEKVGFRKIASVGGMWVFAPPQRDLSSGSVRRR